MHLVLGNQAALARQCQAVSNLRLVAAEQFGDYLFLVTEVVIQVTRRDPQVGRNMVSRDLAFALFIEQRQAGLQDAFTGFHLGFCTGLTG